MCAWRIRASHLTCVVQALGCVFFVLAYFSHPFPEGAKMSILDGKYKIPDKTRYSKKVSKILKLCLHKEPTRRPTCTGLAEHLRDLLAGGKGTLSSKKDKKRSNSQTVTSKTQQHLVAPKHGADQRRNSLGATKEETKLDIDEGWDPFDDDEEADAQSQAQAGGASNDSVFDDDFVPSAQSFSSSISPPQHAQQRHTAPPIANGDADPFFSADFSADFFSKEDARPKIAQTMSSHLPSTAERAGGLKLKKRKSGRKPKPIDDEAYSEQRRQGRRKKKRELPTRSRSKAPTHSAAKRAVRPTTPQPQKSKAKAKAAHAQVSPKAAQEPSVFYGSQLAQLLSMGFNETEKNVNAIVRAKGNVQVAVSILIS